MKPIPKSSHLVVVIGAVYLVVHVLAKIILVPGYTTGNDTPTFIEPAILFAQDFSFGDMIWRTPIYPLFLALHRAIFGADLWLVAATYSQIACSAAAVALLCHVLRAEGVRPLYVIVAATLMIANPGTFFYENRILSETPAFLWVAIFTWAAWRTHRGYTRSNAVVLAVIAGLGPMLRPEYLSISLFIVLYLALIGVTRKARVSSGIWFITAALSLIPSLAWAARNHLILGFFGLTVGVGGATIFHTYEYIELGRTDANGPAVDRLLEEFKRVREPTKVFDADPTTAPVQERIRYWQQIADATFRAMAARPVAYARTVGWAIVGASFPALGRQQMNAFFGVPPGPYRIYQVAHFVIFAIAIGAALIFTSMVLLRFRRQTLAELYVPFLFAAFTANLLLTALLIQGPNNRYRMPFDGLVVAIGVLGLRSISSSARR